MKQISETEAMEMLANAFVTTAAELTRATRKDDIAGWDSMGALSLMAEFDERLGLELPADALKKMQTVADVLEFLKERGALQA